MYDACADPYLLLGNYCSLTCGRCNATAAAPAATPANAPIVSAAAGRPNGGRRLAADL